MLTQKNIAKENKFFGVEHEMLRTITIRPISWLAMKMGDCYNNNGIFFHAIDYPVGKPCQQTPSKSRFYFGTGQGKGSHSSNPPIQVVKKISSQAIRLLVIPSYGIVEFLVGHL